MSCPLSLFTGPWADLPLAELAGMARGWGFRAVELASWGDHLEVQRALGESGALESKVDMLRESGLEVAAVACHRSSAAICEGNHSGMRHLLPEHVWGDGDSEGIRQRASAEVIATARVAARLGANLLTGFTGSAVWNRITGYPWPKPDEINAALADFSRRFQPILNELRELGLRYALEVHPGQMAFDLGSAESVLEALDGAHELGFTLDPGHQVWQGIDPAEFIRRFPDRILHVHLKDVVVRQDGRHGLLGGYHPRHDPRRGWEFRGPGRGHLDWEEFFRALASIGYQGALSVEVADHWLDRATVAEESVEFVQRFRHGPLA